MRAGAEKRGGWAHAVLLALALGGCDGAPAPPDARLVAALVDLHVLEARASLHKDVPPALRDSVLTRHGYTRAAFDAALADAQEDLDGYTALLGAVQERLIERTRAES